MRADKLRPSPRNASPTEQDIRAWLVGKIAEAVDIDPAEIDINAPFADYGLDSMQAVAFAGDLETWLARKLDDTLLWDYPSIKALARYLAKGTTAPERLTER